MVLIGLGLTHCRQPHCGVYLVFPFFTSYVCRFGGCQLTETARIVGCRLVTSIPSFFGQVAGYRSDSCRQFADEGLVITICSFRFSETARFLVNWQSAY